VTGEAPDRDEVAREMLGRGPRREVDPYSVVAADLLAERLRRKEGIARAAEALRGGRNTTLAHLLGEDIGTVARVSPGS